MPPGFSVIGNSKSSPFEFIISEDNRVLALQGHPEFESDFLSRYLDLTANYVKNWKVKE